MRRSEFEVNDRHLIQEVLASCEHGTLCLVDEGEPYAVPLNLFGMMKPSVFMAQKRGARWRGYSEKSKSEF